MEATEHPRGRENPDPGCWEGRLLKPVLLGFSRIAPPLPASRVSGEPGPPSLSPWASEQDWLIRGGPPGAPACCRKSPATAALLGPARK